MDWIKQLNEVITYIDEHLDKDISQEKIAEIACCSFYNFQRVFSHIAQITLADYIRNRKMSLAALDLVNTNDRIIDIALKYGYQSQDAFTRAFKGFHGVLPSMARTNETNLKSLPKLQFKITISGGEQMNYKLLKHDAFNVIGYENKIETKSAFSTVPKLWEDAWQNGRMDRLNEFYENHPPLGYLGIAIGGEWGESDEMRYLIGIAKKPIDNSDAIKGQEHIVSYELPSALWVVINADGVLPEVIENAYHKFYSEWLPSSGYRLADLPVIESYIQENRQEIWIAIEKND